MYRPLTLLSFAFEYRVGGDNPLVYHVTNLLLHAAVSLAVAWACREVAGRATAKWAALLFATHPIHTEAVAAIAGRADLLATLLALAAFTASRYSRRQPGNAARLLAPALFGLALLSKESAIAVPALILAADWLSWKRREMRTWPRLEYAALAAVAVAYLALRQLALGGMGPAASAIDPLDNPLIAMEPALRIYNALAIGGKYLGLLVVPHPLSADYSLASITLAESVSVAGVLVFLATLAAGIWLLYRYYRQPTVWMFAILWALLCFSVVANVAMPLGTIMAERLVYLPSVGFALLTALCLRSFTRSLTGRGVALTASALILCQTPAMRRNEVWLDNFTLFSSVVAAYPQNAKAHLALGSEWKKRGMWEEAASEYRRALAIYPGLHTAHYMLGQLHFEGGKLQKAQQAYRAALAIDPDYAEALLNLGVVYRRLGRHAEAVDVMARAAHLRPRWGLAWHNLGDVLFEMKDAKRATSAYEELLRWQPEHPRRAAIEARLRELNEGRASRAPRG